MKGLLQIVYPSIPSVLAAFNPFNHPKRQALATAYYR